MVGVETEDLAMATLKDEIRRLLSGAPGLTDREITYRLRGARHAISRQQSRAENWSTRAS